MNSKRVLICSYYMPQTEVDSYSRRLFHFVEFLHDVGWSVTCVAKNPQGVEQYASLLEELGASVHVGVEENFERLATTEHFDVAILGFWHIAEPAIKILRRCSPTTRIIVDSGDLHFLRHARRILQEAGVDQQIDILDAHYAQEMVRELNVYAAADAVFAVSRKEAEFVNDFVGNSAHAFVVPDCEELAQSSVPFASRRGLFFVGNFQHLPNGEAVEYLCRDILPQFDSALLADHPVYIAGNAMTESIRKCGDTLPCVRMLGWVPSVLPYLEHVRVSILPLLHGAGTKRKMIQALAIGTPTVSTSIGAEGFDLRDGEEVLIADGPVAFANSIARLLQDEELWNRLARQGRDRILVEHGREPARQRLMESLGATLTKSNRPTVTRSRGNGTPRTSRSEYQEVTRRTREIVCSQVPPHSTVLVASKGDDALLELGDRGAWHFPRDSSGVYAGHHPANSAEAVTHLEALRSGGGDFLVLPKTAFWWLDHYEEFKRHLESRYRLVVRDEGSCLIYSLREAPVPLAGNGQLAPPQSPPEPVGHPVLSRVSSQRHELPELELRRASVLEASGASGQGQVVIRPDGSGRAEPRVSVIIPTHNRAALLDLALQSLAGQALPAGEFEVIVVDDGSTDATADICRHWSSRLLLTCIRIQQSGIAIAKNVGVFAARGPILFFFDDDDIADENLLVEHLKTHARYPLENVAVLGYTDWATTLEVSEVMRFVTDIGHFLFSYTHLADGQTLDYTYFWGGRSSCKKSLLTATGVFRPEFTFGSEDIELGFRLSKLLVERRLMTGGFIVDKNDGELKHRLATIGLSVIFNRRAVQHMNRSVTYDEFCRRCERQGKSQTQFSHLYSDPAVHEWCQTANAVDRWQELRTDLPARVSRVHEIEKCLLQKAPGTERLINELHALYHWTFNAFKLKGIAEEMKNSSRNNVGQTTSADA